MSAGSAASPSSVASPATSPALGPTSATSAGEYSDLEVKWVKDKYDRRTFTYSGVHYTVQGQRAGEYFLRVSSERNDRNAVLDHETLQTLEDCKARIRARLAEDITRFG